MDIKVGFNLSNADTVPVKYTGIRRCLGIAKEIALFGVRSVLYFGCIILFGALCKLCLLGFMTGWHLIS